MLVASSPFPFHVERGSTTAEFIAAMRFGFA